MSHGEADCFLHLCALQRAGEISDLQTQVSVKMTEAQLRWILDFRYFDKKLNETIYADYKGMETPRWEILKKLWPYYGPGRLRVFKGTGARILMYQEIIPIAQMIDEPEC